MYVILKRSGSLLEHEGKTAEFELYCDAKSFIIDVLRETLEQFVIVPKAGDIDMRILGYQDER